MALDWPLEPSPSHFTTSGRAFLRKTFITAMHLLTLKTINRVASCEPLSILSHHRHFFHKSRLFLKKLYRAGGRKQKTSTALNAPAHSLSTPTKTRWKISKNSRTEAQFPQRGVLPPGCFGVPARGLRQSIFSKTSIIILHSLP